MPKDDDINKDQVRKFFNGGREKSDGERESDDKTGSNRPDGNGVPSAPSKG